MKVSDPTRIEHTKTLIKNILCLKQSEELNLQNIRKVLLRDIPEDKDSGNGHHLWWRL